MPHPRIWPWESSGEMGCLHRNRASPSSSTSGAQDIQDDRDGIPTKARLQSFWGHIQLMHTEGTVSQGSKKPKGPKPSSAPVQKLIPRPLRLGTLRWVRLPQRAPETQQGGLTMGWPWADHGTLLFTRIAGIQTCSSIYRFIFKQTYHTSNHSIILLRALPRRLLSPQLCYGQTTAAGWSFQ